MKLCETANKERDDTLPVLNADLSEALVRLRLHRILTLTEFERAKGRIAKETGMPVRDVVNLEH